MQFFHIFKVKPNISKQIQKKKITNLVKCFEVNRAEMKVMCKDAMNFKRLLSLQKFLLTFLIPFLCQK